MGWRATTTQNKDEDQLQGPTAKDNYEILHFVQDDRLGKTGMTAGEGGEANREYIGGDLRLCRLRLSGNAGAGRLSSGRCCR